MSDQDNRRGKYVLLARMGVLVIAIGALAAYGLSQASPRTAGPSALPTFTPGLTPGTGASVSLSGRLDASGALTEDIEVISEDGLAVLKLPSGTRALDAQGQPLPAITVTAARLTLRTDLAWVGLAYEVGPDGATLDPPAPLTITYDPRANYPFAYQDVDTSLVYLAYIGETGPVGPALASAKGVKAGLTSGLGGAATGGTGGEIPAVSARVDHLGTFVLYCEVFSIPLS